MILPRRPPVRLRSYVLAYALIAAFLILAHGPLLNLPFFWDEAGQFIPASLDLFRAGAWIPVSTVPNVHPPGVMAFLALVWTLFGFSIEATRLAMLLVAAAGVLVTFLLAIELSRGATGSPAFLAIPLLCLSPLFFAQSLLAQLDMPALCLSLLPLLLFLQERFLASALICVLLVLVKETGLIVPAVLGGWLFFERRGTRDARQALWFTLPIGALAAWLITLHHVTGHWLGSASFAAYNVRYPLDAARFALALGRRVYYLFISSGHWIGTVVLLWAFRRMPLLRNRAWRIAACFVAAQILVVSLLGGAVLERYLLPALPVVYIAFAVSFRALSPGLRNAALGALILWLIAANFVNPFYPFPFENNLSFVSFVQLEQQAIAAANYPGAGRVATVFPLADGLRHPDLGFVERAQPVIELADFSADSIENLKASPPAMLIVYQRVWDPLGLVARPPVRDFLSRHYGYVAELSAPEIAQALSMRITGQWKRSGLTMELLQR